MRKFIKVGALIIGFIVMAIVLTSCKGCKGCKGDEPKDPVIVSIEIVSSTVPSSIYTDEVNSKLGSIQIKVVKSDESSEVVNLNTSMISASDLSKLYNFSAPSRLSFTFFASVSGRVPKTFHKR
jgi:hypothetical protein